MSSSKVGGACGAWASISILTPGGFVLFPIAREKSFFYAGGIIHPRPGYSTAKGHFAPASTPPATSTASIMNDHITHDLSNDGIDRRGFLKCMAWAGTG